MSDPNTAAVQLDPNTLRVLWGAVVAFCVTMSSALAVIAAIAVKARIYLLRNERANKTDDLVHGTGSTIEPPKEYIGLVKDVEQLKNVMSKTVERVRNIEIHEKLPDMSDPAALAKLALERLDTGQHRAVIIAEEEHRKSLPPPPPFDTRWKGRPR